MTWVSQAKYKRTDFCVVKVSTIPMRTSLIVAFLLITGSLFAQLTRDLPYGEDNFILSYTLSPDIMDNHQITGDFMMGDDWSLLYRATFNTGMVSSREIEYVLPVGTTVSVGLASALTCGACCGYNDGWELLIYPVMIPDGVAYHAHLSDFISLSPYVVFSGLGIYDGDEGTRVFYAPSIGMRAYLHSPNLPLFLVVDGQGRRSYSGEMIPSLSTGLSIRF
ncbi:MAG: hypothetical protein RL220_848 [Bacteroidota bacterium]